MAGADALDDHHRVHARVRREGLAGRRGQSHADEGEHACGDEVEEHEQLPSVAYSSPYCWTPWPWCASGWWCRVACRVWASALRAATRPVRPAWPVRCAT